jgi:hypothetical protein
MSSLNKLAHRGGVLAPFHLDFQHKIRGAGELPRTLGTHSREPYLQRLISFWRLKHSDDEPEHRKILSSPGHLCMTCMGFLTEEKLGRDAARYGNVGGRPQVIWSNGVLASTAVGIAMELVTGWARQTKTHAFLVYDGNNATLQDSITLKNLAAGACPPFRDDDIGDPVFKPL